MDTHTMTAKTEGMVTRQGQSWLAQRARDDRRTRDAQRRAENPDRCLPRLTR